MSIGGSSHIVPSTGKTYPPWSEYAIKEFFQNAISSGVTGFSTWKSQYGTYMGAYPTSATQTVSPVTGYTYAGQDANEVAGIVKIATRATTPNAAMTKARTLLDANVADSSKLSANTYAPTAFTAKRDMAIQEFDETTLPDMAHSANMVGRFGGSTHAFMQYRAAETVMKDLLGKGEETIYPDYKAARNIQQESIGRIVPFTAESLRDFEMLRAAGMFQREHMQGMYDDSHDSYTALEMQKIKDIKMLGDAIGMLKGTAFSELTPYRKISDVTQIAGLALTGLSLYASAKSGKEPPVNRWNTSGNSDTSWMQDRPFYKESADQ